MKRDVFNAWIGGESQASIGDRLGLAQQTISDICQSVLKSLTPEAEAELVRTDVLACLQQLKDVHLERVLATPPPAFSKTDILRDENGEVVRDYRAMSTHTDAVLKCLAQLRALLGLDAPTKMESKVDVVRYTIEGVDMEQL